LPKGTIEGQSGRTCARTNAGGNEEVEIRAWRGVRFNPQVVEDPGAAIGPPYDVIDEAQQEELYARSPYNIVRIIKGKKEPGDDGTSNVYTRAAESFQGWLSAGALVQDPEPALYVYRQDFSHEGRPCTRLGLVCLARIEEFGKGIMAHEKTLAAPKKDRLELTRATGAQFGNIFALYDEPEKRVDALLEEAAQGAPLLGHTDRDGVTHSLYAITDPAKHKVAEEVMRAHPLFIADGHHRYETALNFSRENVEVEASQFVMLTLVNMRNEGLVILPTHRLVKNVEGFSAADLLTRLEADFALRSLPSGEGLPREVRAAMREEMERGRNCFGLYTGDGKIHVAALKDPGRTAGLGGTGMSKAWKGMDVVVLHHLVLDEILGIDEEALKSQKNVEYIKDIGDAVREARAAVDSGRCQALFLQNPPRMSEMKAVCEAGERMPQKSTFFHPKIYSGLVIHKML